MNKPIYSKKGWVLGRDDKGHLNYVEPHGTTAYCTKCKKYKEHENIPYNLRDISGTRMVKSNPSIPKDKWIKAKAVKFCRDGRVQVKK